MKLYVASSWRNTFYPTVVHALEKDGHEIHDWRQTVVEDPNRPGFRWSDIDGSWQSWTPQQYVDFLRHPLAEKGFANDMEGVHWCEAMIYLMPCGVSASLEAAYAKGQGKPVACYVPAMREPDLMVKIFDVVTASLDDVLRFLRRHEAG